MQGLSAHFAIKIPGGDVQRTNQEAITRNKMMQVMPVSLRVSERIFFDEGSLLLEVSDHLLNGEYYNKLSQAPHHNL